MAASQHACEAHAGLPEKIHTYMQVAGQAGGRAGDVM